MYYNKSELIRTLLSISEQVVHEVFPGLVIITHGENVLSYTPCDIDELIGCIH